MRAVIVITDSAAMPTFERAFVEGGQAFTLLPEVVGAGRTGVGPFCHQSPAIESG